MNVFLSIFVIVSFCRVFRREVTVTNPTGELISSTDIPIVINTAALISSSKLADNCSTIVFKDPQNDQYITSFLESGCNTTSTNYWIRVSNLKAGNTTIVVDYALEDFFGKFVTWSGNHFIMMSQDVCGEGYGYSTTNFNGKYLRVNNVTGFGGTKMHRHFFRSQTSSGVQSTQRFLNSASALQSVEINHFHNFSNFSESFVNRPPRHSITLCQGNLLEMPTNSLGMFVGESVPSGYEIFTEMEDRFPFCFNGASGEQLGEEKHDHFLRVETNECTECSEMSSTLITQAYPLLSHTHVGSNTSSESLNLPPFFYSFFIRKINDNGGLNENMLIFADSVPPMGYEQVHEFNGRFPRGTSNFADVEHTGGTETHRHFYHILFDQTNDAETQTGMVNDSDVSSIEHDHFASGYTEIANHVPEYADLLLLRRKNAVPLVTVHAEIEASKNPPVSVVVTVIVFSVIAICLSIVLIVWCFVIVVVVVVYKGRFSAHKEVEEEEIELERTDIVATTELDDQIKDDEEKRTEENESSRNEEDDSSVQVPEEIPNEEIVSIPPPEIKGNEERVETAPEKESVESRKERKKKKLTEQKERKKKMKKILKGIKNAGVVKNLRQLPSSDMGKDEFEILELAFGGTLGEENDEKSYENDEENLKFYEKMKKYKDLLIKYDELTPIKFVGGGGSGASIFVCLYKDEYVALKSFGLTTSVTSDFVEFEREISVFSALGKHKNVLIFHGVTVTAKKIGLINEYAPYGDLKNFYKLNGKTFLPMFERLRIVYEIACGMEYLHSQNVIHRDLKPENVLLDKHLVPKIMDFGLSRVIVRMSTKKTMQIGTVTYQGMYRDFSVNAESVAPELACGKNYDNKVDVYSFAIVAYEIIQDTKWNSRSQDAVHNPNIRPDLGPVKGDWLKEMFKYCWDDDPNIRMSFLEIVLVFKKHIESMNIMDQHEEFVKDLNEIEEYKVLEGLVQEEEREKVERQKQRKISSAKMKRGRTKSIHAKRTLSIKKRERRKKKPQSFSMRRRPRTLKNIKRFFSKKRDFVYPKIKEFSEPRVLSNGFEVVLEEKIKNVSDICQELMTQDDLSENGISNTSMKEWLNMDVVDILCDGVYRVKYDCSSNQRVYFGKYKEEKRIALKSYQTQRPGLNRSPESIMTDPSYRIAIAECGKRFLGIMNIPKCQNILEIVGCSTDGDCLGVATELCKTDLYFFLRENEQKIDMEMRMKFGFGICFGMMVLHQCRIPLRHLTLSNVLVTKDLVAKINPVNSRLLKNIISGNTRPIGYEAYEQRDDFCNVSSLENGQIADIFSFGACLYAIITNEVELGNVFFENNERSLPNLKEKIEIEWIRDVIESCWRLESSRATFEEIYQIFMEKFSSKELINTVFTAKELEEFSEDWERIKKEIPERFELKETTIYMRGVDDCDEDAEDHSLKDFTRYGLLDLVKHQWKEVNFYFDIESLSVQKDDELQKIETDADVANLEDESMIVVKLKETDE